MTAAPTVVSTTSTTNQPLQPDVPIFGTAAAGEPTQHVEVGAVASPNLSDTPTEMIPSSPDPLNTLSPSTLPLPPVPAQAVLDPTVLAGMPTPDPAVLAGMPVAAPMMYSMPPQAVNMNLPPATAVPYSGVQMPAYTGMPVAPAPMMAGVPSMPPVTSVPVVPSTS